MKKFTPFILTTIQCFLAWQMLVLSVDKEVWYGLRVGFGGMALLSLIQANFTYQNGIRNGQ